MDIERLLSLPEGKILEFKKDLSSLKPILKTLVAFANTAGGTLIIGRDNNGALVGVDSILSMEEKLANTIADSIFPLLIPEIEIVSIKKHPLLVVRVFHFPAPFYLKSEGNTNGVYIRLGSTNRIATPEMLTELKRSISRVSFDQLPCPEVHYSGLDKNRIERVFDKTQKKITQQLLTTLGVLVPYRGKLVSSNGGVILFGKEALRKKYFPNTEVRCARFQGESKVNFIDQYDISGTILDAMEEVPKFIQRNTRLGASIEKMQRKNIEEYSSIVIREILTNALVHADYSIKGMSFKIAIFSNRLEIESPGMLPFGYTFDDFFSGISHVRNKVITRVFRELNLMEEWGTGYKRIHQICQSENYPIPHWEEVCTTLKVTLKPHQMTQESKSVTPALKKEGSLNERQKTILNLLRNTKIYSTKQIYQHLKGIAAERTLRKDLLDLKEKEMVQMIGRGPSTTWKLI